MTDDFRLYAGLDHGRTITSFGPIYSFCLDVPWACRHELFERIRSHLAEQADDMNAALNLDVALEVVGEVLRVSGMARLCRLAPETIP